MGAWRGSENGVRGEKTHLHVTREDYVPRCEFFRTGFPEKKEGGTHEPITWSARVSCGVGSRMHSGRVRSRMHSGRVASFFEVQRGHSQIGSCLWTGSSTCWLPYSSLYSLWTDLQFWKLFGRWQQH